MKPDNPVHVQAQLAYGGARRIRVLIGKVPGTGTADKHVSLPASVHRDGAPPSFRTALATHQQAPRQVVSATEKGLQRTAT